MVNKSCAIVCELGSGCVLWVPLDAEGPDRRVPDDFRVVAVLIGGNVPFPLVFLRNLVIRDISDRDDLVRDLLRRSHHLVMDGGGPVVPVFENVRDRMVSVMLGDVLPQGAAFEAGDELRPTANAEDELPLLLGKLVLLHLGFVPPCGVPGTAPTGVAADWVFSVDFGAYVRATVQTENVSFIQGSDELEAVFRPVVAGAPKEVEDLKPQRTGPPSWLRWPAASRKR